MKPKKIEEFWKKSGKNFDSNKSVTQTSRDPYLGALETEKIINSLKKNMVALEIGCGDGLHSIEYAKKIKKLYCLDIVEDFLKILKRRAKEKKVKNVEIITGSVVDLEKIFPEQKFDCVISQRCLINMASWNEQKSIIRKVHNLLNKKGSFLLTEGFNEGLVSLNKVRKVFGIKKMKKVPYNRFFIKAQFEKFINKFFEIKKINSYGLYLLLSRTLGPLASRPFPPKHDSSINESIYQIALKVDKPVFDKYSYNFFYNLEKK